MSLGLERTFCSVKSTQLSSFNWIDRLTIIAGQGQGDTDGMQSHSKLCQPIGICVEFNCNIYVADSGSGAVKIFNRSLRGILRVSWKVTNVSQGF